MSEYLLKHTRYDTQLRRLLKPSVMTWRNANYTFTPHVSLQGAVVST